MKLKSKCCRKYKKKGKVCKKCPLVLLLGQGKCGKKKLKRLIKKAA